MTLLPLLLASATLLPQESAPHQIGGQGAPLRESDAGRVIPAGIGTTIVIVLTSNAGTGYHWRTVKVVNAEPVGPISTRPDPGASTGMVGGPLLSNLRLKLDHVGMSEVVVALDPPGRGRHAAKVLRYRFGFQIGATPKRED